MAARIERTLTHERHDGRQTVIRQDAILSFHEPVVILGDPGLGKTVLTQWLGEQPGMKFVRAGTFVRTADPSNLVPRTERIVVDGLDEIASAAQGGAVDAVLKQLSAAGNPAFVLSCRAADWLGAADRVKIEDDYGAAPVLLHLRPFTEDDARAFLSEEFPAIDSAEVLEHLVRCGIESLYENPLTLRMLGEVAQDDGPLPETRAHLFGRACRVMLQEPNPRHHRDSHARRSEEELLMGAGALCAAQLLCGRIGIFDGPNMETPEGYLNAGDIAALRFGGAANDALRVRLFQSEGENRFTHVHRVIAEYLGARWLARSFEAGVSEKRIFALFRQGEGVPTSLRGLHAWLAHFNETLARRCIEADPYAVLRYGDAETLSLDQARSLLSALKKLSEDDPFFRAEDWGRHPASGLLRAEFEDDIRAIIEPSCSHIQLTNLLLEAMVGTELAHALAPTLRAILYDRNRLYDERNCALLAWRNADPQLDSEGIIRRLHELKDPDSARLAFDLLLLAGASTVSVDTAADTVLAHLGFAATLEEAWESAEVRYVPDRLYRDLTAAEIAPLLDRLVDRAQTLKFRTDFDPNSELADLVRRFLITILESGATVEPARLWSWIGWMDGRLGYRDREKEQLAEIFRDNRTLRASLVEHVLLASCAGNVWMAGGRLARFGPGLYPTVGDLVGVLRVLRARAAGGPIDPETYRQLLSLGSTEEGLPTDLRNAALAIADGDSELLSIVDQVSNPAEPEWKIEEERNREERKAERQRIFQSRRDSLAERTEEIAAGAIGVLVEPANVYLGQKRIRVRHHASDDEPSTEDVVREFLGEDLAERVMGGFIASLGREDLPTASSIAEVRCESKHWPAEAVMICGVEELLRRGQSIQAINRDTLAAVYMAWQRALATGRRDGINIGRPLEEALFESDADWENHFRTSIEPQLVTDLVHVDELYRLTTDPDLAGLAGRLAVEWLRRYPALRCSTQKRLLACALDCAERNAIRALTLDRQSAVHPDREMTLLWLSADYAVDFERRRDMLLEAAANEPAFIWLIQDRIAPDRRDHSDSDRGKRIARFSVAQLSYIVEAFGRQWPRTEEPSSSVGSQNPWDATRFIQYAIETIGGRPTPEATEALQTLIANHAPSYANRMKHVLHIQRRARRDFEYSAPTVGELRSAVTDGLPDSIDQMRAFFADRIEELQKRIRGSNTDMWEAYWVDDRPRTEPFCRNRMIEHISGQLPPSIRFEPERHMPRQRRADIAAIRDTVGLPVEIKGQWHRDVWNAACDQLDANYARDWQAEGRGAYIVLWFGNVPGKNLRKPPDDLPRPGTPGELERMLKERLPEARRSSIDVFVIDLSRPTTKA